MPSINKLETGVTLIMNYLEPWEKYHESDSYLVKELRREVCNKHILFSVDAQAIARRCDCDDVLFKLSNFTHQYAVVHLTYSRESDSTFPITELYVDLEDWIKNRMIPDNQDYTI